MSAFWSYPSTSPQTSWLLSSSLCAWNSCQRLGIPKFSHASPSEINLILLHTPRTGVPLKSCSCCDTWWENGSSWQCSRHKRWALRVLRRLSAADSRLTIFAESTLYQPWRASWDSVSSIWSKPVHRSLCLSICQAYSTSFVDWSASFTLSICSCSEISVVKL